MKVEFKKSFLKDIKKLKNKQLKNSVAECIENIESSANPSKIKNIKKLSGYDVYYRIRISDYRLGVKIENNIVTFVVFEHRKDIYKGFP
jgi:mRNA interferase RelE/StbE